MTMNGFNGGPIDLDRGSKYGRIIRRTAAKLCSTQSWKRRVPITIWLPEYRWSYLLRDIIAGITVGLTAIPQGIAYAIIAGLPPQVGLYASIFPSFVYAIFGSCYVVTVGPTAILAALLAKYVAISVDFAYLAAFLSGCIILLLGVLQLGFLLDFISKPVISGFTTAAAAQIAASQLKTLFRISGKSGETFIDAIENFIKNIKTVQLWDPVLGFVTIAALILLKNSSIHASEDSSRCRIIMSKTWLYIVRARNALVVFAGALLAYIFHWNGIEPFALIGKIEGGLPDFAPPPFSTTDKSGHSMDFSAMLSALGAEGLVLPLVAILESIAIARAFAGNKSVDATQEMVAVGMCNVLASFCRCMPATGSFTRTALNHASGVATPAATVFKAALVLLAVTLLTRAFTFIPRATLAAIIMVAMAYIVDLGLVGRLWRTAKAELLVYLVTVITGLTAGLEFGILAGAAADAGRVLAAAARPRVAVDRSKIGNQDVVRVILSGTLSYPCAESLSASLRAAARTPCVLVLDGARLAGIDVGVAENITALVLDLERQNHRVIYWNFSPAVALKLPGTRNVAGTSIDHHVLCMNVNSELNNYVGEQSVM